MVLPALSHVVRKVAGLVLVFLWVCVSFPIILQKSSCMDWWCFHF